MPRTSASRRTLRAFLGLPHSRGFYNRHPEFVEKGQRNTILGHVERDAKGVSRIVPDEPFAESDDIDLERGDVHLDILDEYSRKGIDSGLSAVEEEAWLESKTEAHVDVDPEGEGGHEPTDDSALSPCWV